MATSLTVSPVTAQVAWAFSNTNSFGTSSQNNASMTYSDTLSNGTGADAARYMYAATLTISASTTTNLDLAGSLTDLYGNTLTFGKVKVIFVHLKTTTTASSIKVGGHATAAFGNWIGSADSLDNDQPFIRVRNNGCFLLSCADATGYGVTATTDDILSIVNEDASNAATVDVCIIGE